MRKSRKLRKIQSFENLFYFSIAWFCVDGGVSAMCAHLILFFYSIPMHIVLNNFVSEKQKKQTYSHRQQHTSWCVLLLRSLCSSLYLFLGYFSNCLFSPTPTSRSVCRIARIYGRLYVGGCVCVSKCAVYLVCKLKRKTFSNIIKTLIVLKVEQTMGEMEYFVVFVVVIRLWNFVLFQASISAVGTHYLFGNRKNYVHKQNLLFFLAFLLLPLLLLIFFLFFFWLFFSTFTSSSSSSYSSCTRPQSPPSPAQMLLRICVIRNVHINSNDGGSQAIERLLKQSIKNELLLLLFSCLFFFSFIFGDCIHASPRY